MGNKRRERHKETDSMKKKIDNSKDPKTVSPTVGPDRYTLTQAE